MSAVMLGLARLNVGKDATLKYLINTKKKHLKRKNVDLLY